MRRSSWLLQHGLLGVVKGAGGEEPIIYPEAPASVGVIEWTSHRFLVELVLPNTSSFSVAGLQVLIDDVPDDWSDLPLPDGWTSWPMDALLQVEVVDEVRLTNNTFHTVRFRTSHEDGLTDPEADPVIIYSPASGSAGATPNPESLGIPAAITVDYVSAGLRFSGLASTYDDEPISFEYRLDGGTWEAPTYWEWLPSQRRWYLHVDPYPDSRVVHGLQVRYDTALGTSSENSIPFEFETPGTPGEITDIVVTVVSAVPPYAISVAFVHADTGAAPISNYRQQVNASGNHGYMGGTDPLVSPLYMPYDPVRVPLVPGTNEIALSCINTAGFVGPYSDPVTFEIP
jgi:hypothetical protein